MTQDNIDPRLLDDQHPTGLNPSQAVNGGLKLKETPTGIRKLNKRGMIVGGAIIGSAAMVAAFTFNGTGSNASKMAKDAIAGQNKLRPTEAKTDARWYATKPSALSTTEPGQTEPDYSGIPGMQNPAAQAGTASSAATGTAKPGSTATVPDLTGKAVKPFASITAPKTSAVAYKPGTAGAAGSADGADTGAPAAPKQPTAAEQQAAQTEMAARQRKQQDSDQAMKAGLSVAAFNERVIAPTGQQSATNSQAGAYPASGLAPFGAAQKEDDPNKQDRKDAFLKAAKEPVDPDYSSSRQTAARSKFELKAGGVIPAALISGVNSDIPGQAIASVSDNVYDSKTGQYLLIPQGTKLVGLYDAHVAYGQKRVLLVWNRLIFADGSSFDLKGMPGADKGGFAGFFDEVDNHYLKIFGSAAMLSLISAGVQLSQPNNGSSSTTTTPSVSQTLSGALGQQIGQTAMTITQKNLNIQPTLEIRPGYKFNVMVTADMILNPAAQ